MVQRMGKGMSTELTVEPSGKLLRSAVADEVIAEFALKVADLDATTDEGYEETKKAIRWCVKTRSAVTGLKEELNKPALAHQRAVNAEEKRLIGLVTEVEIQLKAKKQAVDDEVERKRAELEAKHQAWINGRIAESVEVTGKPITTEEAGTWTDGQFAEHIEAGRKAKAEADAKDKAEAARLAQEDADRKAKIQAEQDQIAADRAALARQKAEQDAEAKRIKDEQDQRDRDIEAKLAKIREAEERAARIQPATVIGENDLAGKVLSKSDPLQPIVEAMENFFEFPFPGFPEAEAEAAEDLKGESRDALVLVSSYDEEIRSLIAPNYSEIIQLLETIQVSATRLDALFDDPENVLDNYRGDARCIMGFVENLQYEMDKLAPK